jgi:uncharacterized membrane protein
VLDALLIALYVLLGYFKIPIGNILRVNMAPFAVVICAMTFGPVDGLIVGFLGEFLSQILGPYGLTPTTLLWCVGETARGATLGLCSMLFLKKWLLAAKRPTGTQTTILLSCCVLTGVLASLGQTLALYVDSNMFGYYRYEIVFGVLIWRILVYVVLSAGFGYLSLPIASALRKAKVI